MYRAGYNEIKRIIYASLCQMFSSDKEYANDEKELIKKVLESVCKIASHSHSLAQSAV